MLIIDTMHPPIYWSNMENLLKLIKGKPKDRTHVTGWTWKHLDFDRLCPKRKPGDIELLTLNTFQEPARQGNVIEIADYKQTSLKK